MPGGQQNKKKKKLRQNTSAFSSGSVTNHAFESPEFTSYKPQAAERFQWRQSMCSECGMRTIYKLENVKCLEIMKMDCYKPSRWLLDTKRNLMYMTGSFHGCCGWIHQMHQAPVMSSHTLGLFQKLSWGGADTFLSCGGRVFCWQCVRGVGSNLSWGSRHIWSIVGGVIKALTCPGGRGALTPCVSWGWRGLKKNVAPPRIISGTALSKQMVTEEHYP